MIHHGKKLSSRVWLYENITESNHLHSTESLIVRAHGRSCVLCSTMQVTSLPLSAGVGTRRYSLRTVTVPSGPSVLLVEWFPPTDASHFMVAAGLPSAATHSATTTDLAPAWTVTSLAVFLGFAVGRAKDRQKARLRASRMEKDVHKEWEGSNDKNWDTNKNGSGGERWKTKECWKEWDIKCIEEVEKREQRRDRAEKEVQSVCCAYTPWHPTVAVMKFRGGGDPLVWP